MPVNPRNTLLIKPGDPSDVYQIGKPRFRLGNAPTNGVPTEALVGDDVTQWHSVLWTVYTDPLDAQIAGSHVFVAVWRYYDSASPYVVNATALTAYTKRGQWVQGETQGLALNGASTGIANALSEFIVVPTYNCDRMYFEIRSFQNTSGVALAWLGHALYGVTPRTQDGSTPSVLGAVAGAAGGGTSLDIYNTITVATGAVAIAAVTPNFGVDYELVSVKCHLSAVPVNLNEPFRVFVDAIAGAAYDATLYQVDPTLALGGLTEIVYEPKTRDLFGAGDLIRVTWTNTGLRTYGLQITTRSELSL